MFDRNFQKTEPQSYSVILSEIAVFKHMPQLFFFFQFHQDVKPRYSTFSLTWQPSKHIYWNKRKYLHEKKIQLPHNYCGAPTWPPFRDLEN